MIMLGTTRTWIATTRLGYRLTGRQAPCRGRVVVASRQLSFTPARASPSPIQVPTIPTPNPSPTPREPLPRSLAPRRGLLLFSLPIHPTHWPARLELLSKLISTTTKVLSTHSIALNAVYDGVGTDVKFEDVETYPAKLLFPDGKVFHYSHFDQGTLDDIRFLEDVNWDVDNEAARKVGGRARDGKYEVLVCTHGSRDCRCGDRGGPLRDELLEEVRKRGLENEVVIREIAHVGGHKWVVLFITIIPRWVVK